MLLVMLLVMPDALSALSKLLLLSQQLLLNRRSLDASVFFLESRLLGRSRRRRQGLQDCVGTWQPFCTLEVLGKEVEVLL